MITIRKPNDFHHHLREKELLQLTVKSCFDKFHYVVVMPNLKKPITTIKEALEYRKAEPAKHVQSLYNLVRKISDPLVNDRSTSKEIEDIARELSNGGWLARIEAECGRLPR